MMKKLFFCGLILVSQNIKAQCTGMETYSNISITQCDSYTTPSGIDLFISGIYNDTIMNSVSCDSIITIDLTILNSTQNLISTSSCVSYTAPDGQVYNTSGVKTAIIPNAAGCDSTITINLTIKNPTSSSITQTACGTYTAPDGQAYTTSGMKTAVITNKAGCDSTITINLTINTVPVASATAQGNTLISASPAGMIYQWIDCNTDEEISSATNQIIEPMSGSYAVIITGTNGCVDTSNCVTVSNTANLTENDKNIIFSVYPNPTNGILTISNFSNQVFEITILDLTGKILIKTDTFEKTTELNLEQFNSGFYILEFKSENKKELIQIIKQ